MKNKFVVRGNVTAIFLHRKDGTILETIIDTADLSKVEEFPRTWYAVWDDETNSFYVCGKAKKIKGVQGTVRFHRYILDAIPGMVVDHINHDTLDNRRANLREVTNAENGQNRKGAQRNSHSGILGVHWHKKAKKWQVHIRVNGKQKYIGVFGDQIEAEQAAIIARLRAYPYLRDLKQTN